MTEKPTYEELENRIRKLEQAEADHKKIEDALHQYTELYRTEQKKTEYQINKKNQQLLENQTELAKSEELFRGLFDHMTSGCGIYEVINDGSKGSDYIIKGFNKKSLEIEGQTLEQVMGKSLFDLRPTVDDFGLISVLKRVWETGTPDYYPVKIYQDEKFSNYYENYVFKIPSGEVVTVYNDVTDQKNNEMALKESMERFELAMQFANDGLYDWNLITNKIYYSNGWKRMLGYEPHEIKNELSEWERLTKPEDIKACWEMLEQVIEKKRDRFEKEFQMQHRKGHKIYIHSRANVIFDEHGQAVRVVGTHVDITERKKAELEKNLLQKQLAQAQKMESIGTLTGGIAHDFNNILGIIMGNTELALMNTQESNPAYSNLKQIEKAGLRATNIVRQLLSFSRKTDPKKRPIKIALVIKEALKFLRVMIPTTIEIVQDIHSADENILADPTQINQIMMNLCINAFHAMEQTGGTLTVHVKTVENPSIRKYPGLGNGRHVKISVKDTGPGIAPDIMNRIFDPYFTTKEVGKGSGLGLAVVHGIVKNHNAGIFVHTRPGQGAVFNLLFPVAAQKTETKQNTAGEFLLGSETVLFVDDETSIVEMAEAMLTYMGYRPETRNNPVDALALFKSNPHGFDLVITDMTMPHMSGIQLSEKLMAIRPDIPIIIATGYSALVDEKRAKTLGIRACLMKPIIMAELSKTIRKVLD
ncbi:PAS domain-containing hybrid sensor histidine kinase/response regulator [Desulfobacula toluolica]|uniref:histidine kinase n=1 Tax=Desulfobacula toluolica (strain DSM 7467 / Tol2) TaxID=651182 RepID=K0NKL2_DESTT|nr:PAS domain-containing sensor histidine kinase [Desulfobacula toluolica]CCK82091.1 two component system sensor histidine kinase, hybrid [Desulfobacula toluolica Tol2]